jgi:hypothetical protein
VITIAQNFQYGIHFAGVRLVRRGGIGLVTGVSRS